jgi:hypothetical protein
MQLSIWSESDPKQARAPVLSCKDEELQLNGLRQSHPAREGTGKAAGRARGK